MATAHGARFRIFLVQDHGRCLWNEMPRKAMREKKIELLTWYPKRFQDLNPVQTAWRGVSARRADIEPRRIEARDDFVVRLRQAVAWVDQHRNSYCTQLRMLR